ncbi:MAG: hypothetical protein IKK21_03685 [Clostridia bacterium]|nr:hypothetical protein [Clostridia bacterium]
MKKFLFCVLALALVLTAASAFATTTTYTGTVDPIVIDQPGEHTIILDGVTISLEDGSALRLEAPATKLTIILKDGTESTLTSNDAYAATLSVSTGTLVIRCERAGEGHVCDDTCGKLTVYGGDAGAAIGSDAEVHMSGSITIAGGHITARNAVQTYGSGRSAAIGCGDMAGMSGTILISGGVVNATSVGTGAAIGGGTSYTTGWPITNVNLPMSGNIIITGGIVNAIANHWNMSGVAIGATLFGEVTGTITISGGKVTATSTYTTAIGSGQRDMSGTISITGGKVVAEGRPAIGGDVVSGKILLTGGDITAEGLIFGAAIGSGQRDMSGTITIGSGFGAGFEATGTGDATIGGGTGGGRNTSVTVHAITVGAESAAIGSGRGGDVTGRIVILSGADVTAITKGVDEQRPRYYAGGAGIGSGVNGNMNGDIIINGATVNAITSAYGAGIGAGDDSTMGGSITISGGATVTATGGEDATGIGVPSNYNSSSYEIPVMSGSITITDSIVTATGSNAGIGSAGNMSGSIAITASTVTATGGSAGIGSAGDMSGSLAITDSTVTATGGSVGIGGVVIGSEGSVTITDSTVTARGAEWGNGIGSGSGGWMLGTIRLINSTINAYGGESGGVGVGTSMDARLPSMEGDIERGIRSAAKSYPIDEWYDEVYIGRGGKLIISGGTVNAYGGGWNSAGIGGDVGPMCMDIIIESGTVTAVGGKQGPGIGTYFPADMFGSLTVKGGHVKAISGDAATPAISQTADPIWDEYMDILAEEAVICVDPARGSIEVKVGASEEDAAPLADSPFSARTDLIPLLNREAYVEFLPVIEPTPVPVVPTTGDSMNLALVALIAVLSLGGTVVLRRLHKA